MAWNKEMQEAIKRWNQSWEKRFPESKKIRKLDETLSKKDLELRWHIIDILNKWHKMEYVNGRCGWDLEKMQKSAKKDMQNLLKLATIEKIKKLIPFEWNEYAYEHTKKPFKRYYEFYSKNEKILEFWIHLETKQDGIDFKKANK